MKMNEFKPYVIFFGIVFFIFIVVYGVKEFNYSKNLIKNIKDEYKAIIIEIYNPREWMKEPTFVRMRKINNTVESLAPGTDIMNYINVGDSLIKIKDENICYVKKPNGEKKQFYYTRISMKDRSHWTFPKEWKNKWMESSAWDTLQR